MIRENFSEGDTLIHRLDPRLRIISALLFSLTISVSDRIIPLLLALLISITIVIFAKLPFRQVCLRLFMVNILLFMLWLFIPFSMDGNIILQLGPLSATIEGVIYCITLTVRSNSIILLLMALIGTMSVFKMGNAMRSLYVPGKMVFLFIFTSRYIHAIHREYRRLKNAIEIRGFRSGTNMHTYKTYAYLIGMLLIKSYDRAERVRAAMLCRGFNGKIYDLSEFSLRPADIMLFFIISLALITITLLQWTTVIY